MVKGKTYLGNNEVSKIYLGATTLYEKDTFTGISYYISNTGDITNLGTTEDSPWPLIKVQSSTSYPEGVRIRFNRGEIYTGQVITSGNTASNPLSPLIYDSYGTGASPILTTVEQLEGWNNASNWTLTSYSNVWVMSLPLVHNTYPRIYVKIGTGDLEEATRARLDSLVDATHLVAFANIGPPQQLYIYSIGNPSIYYSEISYPSQTQAALTLSSQNNVIIKDLDIRGGSGSSLNLEFAKDVIVSNCKIGEQAGHSGIAFNRCINIRVTNNIIDSGDNLIDDFIYQHGVGDGVLIGKGNTNIEVDNNTIMNWGHSCVEITSEDPEQVSEPIVNVHIHDNDISAPNVDYCRGMAVNCNVGSNILINYNNFHDLPVQNQLAANGGLIVENNIFNNITNCVNYDVSTGIGISIIGYSGFKPRNMIIRYNIFSNCDAAGIDMGNPFETPGYQTIYDNDISNNTFINNGKNVKNPSYDTNMHVAGVQLNIRTDEYVLNNTYNDNRFIGNIIYRGVLKNVDEFNLSNGNLGDVIIGNLNIIE